MKAEVDPGAGLSTSPAIGNRWRVTVAALTGVGYFALAWLAYTLSIRPGALVVVWAPSGFALALLILLDRKVWPAVVAGALLGNVAADLLQGAMLAVAIEGSAANCFEAWVAALVVVRLAGRHVSLGTLREVGVFVLGAAIVSNGLTALLGALVLSQGWHADIWHRWFVWWTGDGMGMLLIAPAILTWAHAIRLRRWVRDWRTTEAVVVFAAIAVAGHFLLVQGGNSNEILGDHPFFLFPLLMWAAVRLGPRGAATGTLIVGAVAVWNASRTGVPAGPSGTATDRVLEIYSFLALASITSLIPASILSEQGRAQRKLEESELRFREMAEHIREAFFVVDTATRRILYTSPMWSEIWGRPIAEAYDPVIWFESIHPDDRVAMVTAQAAVARGEASTTIFRVVRPDGAIRWVRGQAFPVRDESGRVCRLVGMSEDITAARLAEAHLAQAQKMEAIGQLTGGVAHDFNNLLTVVISHTDLLLEELSPGDARREDVAAIRKAGDSAAALTRQLLVFSRQQIVQPLVLRPADIIGGTIKMLKRLIGEHIELVTTFEAEPGSITIDAGQLEQVIVNLAVNARDAMPDGGRLHIESASTVIGAALPDRAAPCPAGRYVSITVADTGAGMSAETQAHVFEPFFTTKPVGKGTGLGLATVYGIVKQNGGHISIQSALGTGTTFTIYFPQCDAGVTTRGATPASTKSVAGAETLLVVEDDPAVRRIIARSLTQCGYHVLEAINGERALELAERHAGPIDMLVTDVVLPRMNGRVLADTFAKLRPKGAVLFISGYTDDTVVVHGVRAAVMHYLQKPFTATALLSKVRSVLDNAPE